MSGKAAKQRRNREAKRQARMKVSIENMQDNLRYRLIDNSGREIVRTGKEWKQIAEVFKRALNEEKP